MVLSVLVEASSVDSPLFPPIFSSHACLGLPACRIRADTAVFTVLRFTAPHCAPRSRTRDSGQAACLSNWRGLWSALAVHRSQAASTSVGYRREIYCVIISGCVSSVRMRSLIDLSLPLPPSLSFSLSLCVCVLVICSYPCCCVRRGDLQVTPSCRRRLTSTSIVLYLHAKQQWIFYSVLLLLSPTPKVCSRSRHISRTFENWT